MKKRCLALVLAILMVGTLFAACGNQSAPAATTAASSNGETAAPAASADKKVTIKLGYTHSNPTGPRMTRSCTPRPSRSM